MASFKGKHRAKKSARLVYVPSVRLRTQTAILHYRARGRLKVCTPAAGVTEVTRRASGADRPHIRQGGKAGNVQAASAERYSRTGSDLSSCWRSSTTASVMRTVDAHAGHCHAQLPTQLQSWQRYAEARGMYSIASWDMGSPPLSCTRRAACSVVLTHVVPYLNRCDPLS
jgi:hypothetical protein